MPGMTNTMRNQIIDWFMRGEAMTPPTSFWVALCSSAPTAASAGTAISGTGYARVEVPATLTDWCGTQGSGTTSASNGTSGITSNNAVVDFGTAGSSWGTVTHWELYDASSGGNRWIFGTIVDGSGVPIARSISSGDPVSFPIGALQVPWV